MKMKCLAFAPLVACLTISVYAADKNKPQDTGMTREQGDAILKELQKIRELLESGALSAGTTEADGKVRLKVDGDSWLGSKDAPLTMVEFTDYQCGFCRRFHTVTFPEIKKKYIDTGKVRFASRDLPLEFHSNAFKAAQAARCAGEQHLFWEMRDRLVENAAKLSPQDIDGYAKDLKLDVKAFNECTASDKYADAIRKDAKLASSLRIDGTPSFVIGKSTRDGVVGEIVVGALPLDAFDAKLADLAR